LAVETVILDACCTLNLSATSRIEVILRRLPYEFTVGSWGRREAQWLSVPDLEERESVDLEPLIRAGVLTEEELRDRAEEALFVELGLTLADGEAEAAALAISRGYVLATDDRKARRVVAERHPSARLTGTLELLHAWQSAAAPSEAEVADALRRISERATYRPRRTHPLYTWWSDLMGE